LNLKTKIFKILPYWLIVLLLLVCFQTAGFLLPLNNLSQAAYEPPIPEVLDASTTVPALIRGDAQPAIKDISQINNSDLSAVSAESFLVFDLSSGQELLAKNPNQKLAIASLTKLMTALTSYNNLDLNQSFKVSNNDVLKVSPDLGLIPGDQVKALDVFDSMLIGSCNDAAVALSDFTSQVTGNDFVGLMNKEAGALGMQNSSFSNPMGFDSSGNYSTAEDLKLLITATQQLSVFNDLGRMTGYSFTGQNGKIYSTVATNTLLKDHPDIQAIKTGFTDEANGAMAVKVSISGHQIVILVLDSQNRESDTLKLKAALESDFNWE
jgi:D-alanyl-D-alanine carboxypeptidase